MSLVDDIFPEGIEKAKHSRYKPKKAKKKSKSIVKTIGGKAVDVGYHDILGKARTKKQALATRRSNKRVTKRIAKQLKKRFLW